jgi:hypothetical protein
MLSDCMTSKNITNDTPYVREFWFQRHEVLVN